MSRFDVTSIGETLIRLSVYPGTRLEDTNRLTVHTAGAETNVLAALSQLGYQCGWIGGLATNGLGRRAAGDLRRYGIDLSAAFFCSSLRMGVFYVEHAREPLVTNVVYDRETSCASSLSPDLVDWEVLLDTRLIHLTGITPALSASALVTAEEAISKARDEGVRVSFDINYRAKLWSTSEASQTLGRLIETVDVLICSHRDAILLFDCDDDPSRALRQLGARTEAEYVVLTRGGEGAIASDGSSFYEQAAVPVVAVDRTGAGDAFAAGVLHGVLGDDIQMGLRFGTALGALVLGQFGDMVTTNLEEVAAVSRTSGLAKDIDR